MYRGEPNGTEYFTTLDAINRSGQKASVLYEGLQVEKHPILGYRNEMHGYLFTEDVAYAFSLAKSNPQFGQGGYPQYFVPNVQELIQKGILKPVNITKLY